MGEIYLAVLRRQGAFEKHLVIKRILPALSTDPEFLAMFNREARIAALLNHQNVVQVYDFGCERGEYYIAMEYVDGADLRTAIKLLGPPTVGAAWALLGGIARALDYAHRLQSRRGKALRLVHRDVSPGNVLVSREGEVKLTDFGLVTSGRAEFETEAGAMKGKYGYMSPEQTFGDPVDARSDIFSWGILAYEVLSGSRPFQGNMVETVGAIREARYQPLSLDGIPGSLTDLVHCCLQRHVDDRPQHAAELLEVLDQAAREAGWGDTTRDLAEWVRPVATQQQRQPDCGDARTSVGDDPIRDPAVDTLAAAAAARLDSFPMTEDVVVTPAGRRPIGRVRALLMTGALTIGLMLGGIFLFGSEEAPTDDNMPISETTSVEILSDPPGAELTVGDTVVGTSPITLEDFELTTAVDVIARLEGHEVVTRRFRPEDLDIDERGLRLLTILLPVQPAMISVESTPPGVDVFLDGEPQGTTPLTLTIDRFGERWFALEAQGFRAEDFHIDVVPGTIETRTITMVPVFDVLIDGDPTGAQATITFENGGTTSCETPCDVTIETGTVSIVVSAPNHGDYRTDTSVTGDVTVDYELDPIIRRTQVGWRSSDLRLRGGRTLTMSGSSENQSVSFESDSIRGRLNASFEERGGSLSLSLAFQVTPWGIASFDGDQQCETPCTIDLDGVGRGTHRILLQPGGEDPGSEIRLVIREVTE